MAGSNHGFSKTSSIRIPSLYAQIDQFHSGSAIASLQHGYPSGDPTGDGLFEWKNPEVSLFTQEMTQEVLDLNPVLVLQRYIPNARNASKGKNMTNTKRWVVPGNISNNGLQFHGGDSGNYRGAGSILPQIDNFVPIMNTVSIGYNHVMFNKYELPVSRFVSNLINGVQYGSLLSKAFLLSEWNDEVVYSRFSRFSNYHMKFRLVLAVPNPTWTSSNHENKWIFGEGQTIVVEPKTQTFDDGSGILEYYVGWKAKVVN